MIKKKAVTSYLITIILAVVVFFIILNYIMSSSEYITSEADDIACRSWISSISSIGEGLSMPIGEALKQLNFKCKKENIEIKSEKREEVFSQIADKANKCWYRYGEGEYNFLSKLDTTGNWCFTCAKISFDNNGEVYSYYNTQGDSFIEWLSNNYITLSNNTRVNYLDYANYRISTLSKEELLEIRDDLVLLSTSEDFEELEQEQFQNLLVELTNKNLEIIDLNSKIIDTNSEIYVVYRYDVIDKNIIEDLTSSLLTASIASAGVALGTSTILTTVGMTIICPPCGLVVGSGSAIRGLFLAKKVEDLSSKMKTLKNVVDKVSSAVRIIKKSTIIGATAGTAVVSAQVGYIYNDNHVQYIDILTKEQYYRNCGTEPVGFERGFLN